MAYFKTIKSNVYLHYSDYGKGKPVVLIHGWPLSSRSWDLQIPILVENGYRVITYDRRGFGKSEATIDRYDYDALARDLHELIEYLNLDKPALVGFSMGGGEVIRYLTKYAIRPISKAALISSIIPIVGQTPDNPKGVPEKVLQDILTQVQTNRLQFLKQFHKGFYNVTPTDMPVSQEQLDFDWSIASQASDWATLACAKSWAFTDFRDELPGVEVPVLIVHGTKDQTVPIETSAEQAQEMIPNNVYKTIQNGPHGLNITHAQELNELLVAFLKS